MQVSRIEKKIGINNFYSPFDGLDGKLRTIAEDFQVNEISNYPKEDEDGIFTIADVISTSWETNSLVKELSSRLHISRQRIGFAGTKDKRAKTQQIMSFYNIQKEKLSLIKIKDVEIKNIYKSKKGIKIGNLQGNIFKIKIRNINQKINNKTIKNYYNFFQEKGGFPNYFGIQRFGIIRPITHIVGRYIIKNDWEKAVMTYIANPIKGEDEDIFLLRKNLEKTLDYSKALKNYPDSLNFEKAILNKLIIDSDDFINALKELPKNLLTMFIYAYQSYLFNKIISERIKRNIPLNEAIIGDIIIPIRKGVFEDRYIFTSEQNISKVNTQISKDKAAVSGILFGFDSLFSKGEMGEIEQSIIEKEKIDPRDFIIADIPYLSSAGLRRPIFAFIKDLEMKLQKDELNPDLKLLFIRFELNKGVYATSFIREIMKSQNIKNY